MALSTPVVTEWVIVKDEARNSEIATASSLKEINSAKQSQYGELKTNSFRREVYEFDFNSSSKSIGIDTYDLELYLEDKQKSTNISSKTIGIDTSDLEAHYEYYKQESIKQTKTVSTDTKDLDYLKRAHATSIASVDTNDLQSYVESNFVNLSCHNGVCKTETSGDNEAQSLSNTKKNASRVNNNLKESRRKGRVERNYAENDSSDDNKSDEFWEGNHSDFSDTEGNRDEVSKTVGIKKEKNEETNVSVKRKAGRPKGSAKFGGNSDSSPGKRFECEVCKATFSRKHTLTLHLCVHSGLRPFTCSDCGKTFSTSAQAQKHSRMHEESSAEIETKQEPRSEILAPEVEITEHDNQEAAEGEENNTSTSASETTGETKVSCTTCDMSFVSKQILMQHKRTVHSITNRPRECLTCGKVFTCSSALKCHETVHSGVRDYACVTCGKAFPTKTCLKAHESTHTGVKRFVCQTCGKAFAKKDSLKVHNRKHTNERPFSCDLCGRAFDRAFTLKNHRLTHTGEKTHMCAVCGKAFSTRGALSTHERIRHNTDPDKPKVYKRRARDFEPSVCDQCGKVYSNRGNLRIHKASAHSTEKPFLCTACGRSFAKKYTLQCHARKHSNERPFPCDQCNQSFYRKSTLKTHKLRHTGARPYVCPLNCGKAFTQSSSLSYHVRHHDRPPRMATNGKKRKRRKPKPGLEHPPLTLAPLALVGALPTPQEPLSLPPPPITFSTATFQPNGIPPCVTTQSLAQL